MKLVVFGLSVSSAWGNGHATLLRGLFKALHADGHQIHFFEQDTPYYAANRDMPTLPYAKLLLYSDWQEILPCARKALAEADAGMVTSYCPDGAAACALVLDSKVRSVFYDMDTPVTLSRLEKGEKIAYLPGGSLAEFDLVLSYTGGQALERLRTRLGANRVAPLYGWVDPDSYYRVPPCRDYEADLSYLGTYSSDRQEALNDLLIEPAQALSDRKFVVAGAMYPSPKVWTTNITHYSHIAPPQHAAFYSSTLLTLNVTRGAMAALGYCPSGRLFEAAACGTAVLSDWWLGLDTFFEPDQEIVIGRSAADTISILTGDCRWLQEIGSRAKERTLDCHTAAMRARRLVSLLEQPQVAKSDATYTAPVALTGRA